MYLQERKAVWTNAAYPAAGIYAAIQWPFWLSFMFLAVMLYMGATSWGYHWHTDRNKKKRWQRLDEGGMYISLWFLFVAFLVAGVVPPWLMAAIGMAVGIFMAFNWERFGSFQAVFCLFSSLTVLAAYFHGPLVLWPLAVFILAFITRQVGQRMVFWWKDLTHGIWHLLTAYGFYLFYELAHKVFIHGHG